MSNRLDVQQLFRWNLHQLNQLSIELGFDQIHISSSAKATFEHSLPVFRDKIKLQWLNLSQQLLGDHDTNQVQRPTAVSLQLSLQLAHAKQLSLLLLTVCESFALTYPYQPLSTHQNITFASKLKNEVTHQRDWWLQILSLVKYLPHHQQQQYIPTVTWLSSQEKAEQLRALRKTVQERGWLSKMMNTTYSLHPSLRELNEKLHDKN